MNREKKRNVMSSSSISELTKGGLLFDDVGFEPVITVAQLEVVPLLKPSEKIITGEEMVRRARTELNANLGRRHAEYLLEHQNEIPEEFRKYSLVFPGTIWCFFIGFKHVLFLAYYNEWQPSLLDWYEDGKEHGKLPSSPLYPPLYLLRFRK